MSTAGQRLRAWLPAPVRRLGNNLYWTLLDLRDYLLYLTGKLPSNRLRMTIYRRLYGLRSGPGSTVHGGCRVYAPARIRIGAHCVINPNVTLDGRSGLEIGDNVSISEGSAIFTLQHDLDSPDFATQGGPVVIEDYVFIGARAIILPGVRLGKGCGVGAGSVVSRDVEPYAVVAGVPARKLRERSRDLRYTLRYPKRFQ